MVSIRPATYLMPPTAQPFEDPAFAMSGQVPAPTAQVDLPDINYEYFLSSHAGGGDSNSGARFYGSTLRLDIPVGAAGTYEIGFVSDPFWTFLNDANQTFSIPVTALNPAFIMVGDCDGDGIADAAETNVSDKDCDSDGICNAVEIAGCLIGDGTCTDCDGNGLPDGCDPAPDCGSIPNACQLAGNDCNSNGILDQCDPDCDDDGVPDDCQIVGNDCNENGIYDGCEVGACCLDSDLDSVFEGCSTQIDALDCKLAGGIFRGPCRPCPDQNVFVITEQGGAFTQVISPPIDCVAETSSSRSHCPGAGPFFDAWESKPNGAMCHDFGSSGQAIPADFFGTGSDAFTGIVCMDGVSLGIAEYGEADTIHERAEDPFTLCGIPSATPATVDIEITELSLVGIPIVVTFGIGDPELWDVTMDLSSFRPPLGSLTATRTHCNGGTYTSVLNVQPRFTFTKVGPPNQGQVLVYDTGIEGVPFVTLSQTTAEPWTARLDPNSGLTGDMCSAFHPGIADPNPQTNCDLNSNGIWDVCDTQTPLAAVGYPHEARKNRYISFVPDPSSQGEVHGYQVTHVPTGQSWFISSPRTLPVSAADQNLTFLVSDATPPLFDFGSRPVIHIGGCMIAPGETYEVRSTLDGVIFSAPLAVLTAATPTNSRWWADVVGVFSSSGDTGTIPITPPGEWTPPDGNMNGFDITAVVKGFLKIDAPDLTWSDLNSIQPDRVTSGTDVLRAVNAFATGTGREFYPFGVPNPPGPQGQGPCSTPPLESALVP